MTPKTRTESDTMGPIEVPADAYYGAQTERARRNFAVDLHGRGPVGICGEGLPRRILAALAQIKGAMAAEHAARGLLQPDVAAAIEKAAAEVVEGSLDDHFVVDVFQTGSGTSSNMNVNEVLARRASELLGTGTATGTGAPAVHPNDDVNRGQSSNDVFPSAVQWALAQAIHEDLVPALTRLAEGYFQLAERTWDDIKTGRTHLMDAMPIRYGQVFGGHARQLEAARDRLTAALPGLLELPLGGTAVGTGVNAQPGVARAVCRRLGQGRDLEPRETENHFGTPSCMDAVVHASGAMRDFATTLYKLANDVRWMASGPSTGLRELRLPMLQPGSSIMPAKVNPVACESVLMLCAHVIGADAAVAFANTQGQFELNTMLPLIGRNTVESAEQLARGCVLFLERCVQGLEVTGVGREQVAANPILATALTPEIGYERAARLAKAAAASGRPILDVAREQTDLPEERLRALLDPAALCGMDGRARPADEDS